MIKNVLAKENLVFAPSRLCVSPLPGLSESPSAGEGDVVLCIVALRANCLRFCIAQ